MELDSTGSITATTSFSAFGLVSRREGSASVFYTFDSEGNVAQRSDATGAVLSNHLLDSHGAIRSGALSEPFGYKGQFGYYTDQETGLQLLTQRYYDPNTGRFLTRDPIGYAGGIGLYSYVTNNPVSWIDVEGRQKKAMPRQPPDDVYTRALKKIADATGGTLNPNWKISPGYTSYNDAIRGLERIGFKKYFNPNTGHWGGSDWEGTIDGNWYHVTVGYPPFRYGMFAPRFDCASPKFVDSHCERFQPSSKEHLIDYLSPSLVPLIPTIMSGLQR